MANHIEIPVTYKGEELTFSAEVLTFGFSEKIEVDISGELILFEPDEERNYRPVLSCYQMNKQNKIDLELLKAITNVFKALKGERNQL
jgi:hypothetical protein